MDKVHIVFVAILMLVDLAYAGIRPDLLPSDPNNPNSRGSRFLVGFMQNVLPRDPLFTVPDAYLLVTTEEEELVEFDVTTNFGGNLVTTAHQVNSSQVTRINFPADDVYLTSITERDKAIIVQTKNNKKISIQVINDEFRSTDGFLALPCDGMTVPGNYLRYNYVVLSTDQDPGDSLQRASQFLIITCDDDTVVTVRPSRTVSGSGAFENTNFGPDQTATQSNWLDDGSTSIQAGKTLFVARFGEDYTGTIISSTRPLVVISGHQCGQVTIRRTACDLIAAQIPPHTTWGKTHLLNPLSGRMSGDYYRFATISDNTQVNITCVDEGSNSPMLNYSRTLSGSPGLNWGQFSTHSSFCPANYKPRYCCLESSEPVVVTQYSFGYSVDSSCNGGEFGDPFMSLIPPKVQYLRCYHLVPVTVIAGEILRHYFSVTVSSRFFQPDRIIFDNAPLESNSSRWNAIYCEGSVICGYGISKEFDNQYHHIYHEDDDGAIFLHTYGFGLQNSYALAGGMELEPVSGTAVTCSVPEGCVLEGSSVTVTCTRSGDLTEQSRVTVNTEDGTARAPGDYVTLNLPEDRPLIRAGNLLNFRGGARQDATVSFPVQVNRDSDDDEPEEDFFIVIRPERTAVIPDPRLRITICGVPRIGFERTMYEVDEDDGSVTVVVSLLEGRLSGNVEVQLATSDGNATAPSDYSATTTTLTFGPSMTRIPVTIPIMDDSVMESVELFFASLSLRTVGSNVIIDPAMTNIKIDDDDVIIPVNCPPLQNPMDGSVVLSGTTPGSTANYSCNNGFVLVGPQMLTCLDSGNWSASPPICQIIVTIGFVRTAYSVDESSGTVTVMAAVLNGQLTQNVEVLLTTSDDSATSPDDYTSTTATLSFSPTVTSIPVMIPIINDTVIEPDEYFFPNLSLLTSVGGVIINPKRARIRIFDNDVMISFDPTSYTVTEGGVANLMVVKNRSVNATNTITITVCITIIDKTTNSDDYNSSEKIELELMCGPGETEVTIPIPTIDDNEVEDTECFNAVLTSNNSNVVVGENTSTVEILDNDLMISFDPTSYTVTEGGVANLMVVKKRSVNATNTIMITVCITIIDKTTNSNDYNSAKEIDMELICGPGETKVTIPINITDDDEIEDTECFDAVLTSKNSTVIVGENVSTVEILDNDVIVMFDPTSYTVTEGVDDNAVISLVRSGDLGREVVVSVSTSDGTATSGSDYSAVTSTVTFSPGVTAASVNVPILNDAAIESVEIFTASLTSDEDNLNIVDDTATVTILDTDTMVSFNPISYTVTECDDEFANLMLVRSGDLTRSTIVTIATSDGSAIGDSDYISLSRQVTFQPGSSNAVVQVGITDDSALESIETFTASLSTSEPDVNIGDNTSTVTIIDNDVLVSFDPISYTVTEGTDRVAQLSIVRVGNLDLPTSVFYQTVPDTADEDDYNATVGTVTFRPGVTRVTVDIPIIDDEILENTEVFFTTLMSDQDDVVIAPNASNAEISILDNDRVTIGFLDTSYTVDEDDGTVTVFIGVISGELSDEVVVDFNTREDTATDPADFEGVTTQLTFGPGSTTQEISIPITNDTIYEPDPEQFFANLRLPSDNADINISPSQASIIINDDDIPNPMFHRSMYTVPEDDTGSVLLCVDIGVNITSPLTYMIDTAQKVPPEAEDSDFSDGTTIIIPVPGTGACIDFTNIVNNDDIGLEGDEAFTITIPGTNTTAWVIITEDDEVSIGFDPVVYPVVEGDSVLLSVVKRGETEGPLVATVSTADGTATAGVDYDPIVAQEVTFQPQVPGPQTIRVTTFSDLISEGDEYLTATVAPVDPRVSVFSPQANVSISEDVIPLISFSTDNVVVGEEDMIAEVCLNLSIPRSTVLEVPVTALSTGSAEDGSDYTAETQVAIFAPNMKKTCVNFTVLDDEIALEGDETFLVTFTVPDGFSPTTPSTATVTIEDDDLFVIEFEEDEYTYPEGDPNAQVCVKGSGEIAQPATATIMSLSQGTASAGIDYGILNLSVTFQPNEMKTHCIPVILADDNLVEGDETFPVTISEVSPTPGVIIGSPDQATVTITDNDVAVIGFERTEYSVGEDDGTVVLTARVLSGTLTSPVVVDVATADRTAIAPEDYSSVVNSLTFTPSNTAEMVVIPITDDSIFEPQDESFIAQLSLVSTGADVRVEPSLATVIISDDDVPEPVFELTMYTVPENDTSGVPLCVDIGVTITEPITYTITTAQKSPPQAEDSDFGTSAEITIPVPGPSACIDFTDLVVDDNVALEGDEAFTIIVGNSMAMVTIVDDDVPEILSPDVTVREDVGITDVCVSLNNPIENTFEITYITSSGSALDEEDFTSSSGTLSITPQTNGRECVGIPIIMSPELEQPEQFMLTFLPAIDGAQMTTSTVTIEEEQPGTIVNDTVIGDPLFTVTLPGEDEFMCYEIHGEDGKHFNLISDSCTSVNALYSSVAGQQGLNMISEIGIYAVESGADRNCVMIGVKYNGCSATVNNRTINSTYEHGGISVRPYKGRWRVSIPNCGSSQVVLWIFCEQPPEMLRLHIARGNNLSPTSHGLVGQFWNIPITVINQANETLLQLFDESTPEKVRHLSAIKSPRTWGMKRGPCYYVGNSQGGPLESHDPNESVIEGKVEDYETGQLFSPTFIYSQFDKSLCLHGGGGAA